MTATFHITIEAKVKAKNLDSAQAKAERIKKALQRNDGDWYEARIKGEK